MARVGIITGSGTYALPDFADPEAHDLETPFGPTLVTEGRWAERTVLHLSRHGEGHPAECHPFCQWLPVIFTRNRCCRAARPPLLSQ